MAAQWYHCTWSTIHYLALGYPELPSPDDKSNYKAFFLALGPVLPCKKCSVNYQRHLQEIPIDPYLANTTTLFEWTVKLHNIVNRENNKPEWTVEQARRHYLKPIKKDNLTTVTIISAFVLVALCILISMKWKR
jgi:hypothetical protein